MHTRVIAALGALGLMTAPAAAADLLTTPAFDPPAPLVYDWTGFWAGAHIGYVWGDVDTPAGFPGSLEPDGVFLGAQASYLYQFDNNVVIGPYIAFPIAIADDTTTAFGGTFEADLNWLLTVGGRVGYAIDRWQPFVFGGLAVGEGEAEARFGAVTLSGGSETHVGFTVGAGVDYAVTDDLSLGWRYAYTHLGDETYTGAFATPATVDFDSHSIAATLNYRFFSN